MFTNGQRYKSGFGNVYTFTPIIEKTASFYVGKLQISRDGEPLELISMGSRAQEGDILLDIDNEKLRQVNRRKLKPIKLSEYEQQAITFLNKTNTSISFEYLGHKKHFDTDKEYRASFEVTISRENRPSMVFQFGNSILDSYYFNVPKNHSMLKFRVKRADNHNYTKYFKLDKPIVNGSTVNTRHGEIEIKINKTPPTEYDVLACIQKYYVGSLEDFCHEFGYDTDSISANKTYLAVQKEYNDLLRLGFTDSEMEALQEIA